MRLLIFSDSHGRAGRLEAALEAQPEAKAVFFLGDVLADAEYLPALYPDRTFYFVRGNCDYFADAPDSGFVTLGGVGIFYTHGHLHRVKAGLAGLEQAARGRGAAIALYGHTHAAAVTYRDGLYLVNPGSVGAPREGQPSYAVIDLTPAGIVPIHINF